jgi:hypothetical protein
VKVYAVVVHATNTATRKALDIVAARPAVPNALLIPMAESNVLTSETPVLMTRTISLPTLRYSAAVLINQSADTPAPAKRVSSL